MRKGSTGNYKGNTETHFTCPRCEQWLPQEERVKGSYCRSCTNEYNREWREKNGRIKGTYKGNTETHKVCKPCGRTFPREEFSKHGYCRECTNAYNAEWKKKSGYRTKHQQQLTIKRRQFKYELIDKLGGKCIYCGYDKYKSALDFHHVGDDKITGISELLTLSASSRKYREMLLEEVQKCVLVCRNCHMALHSGELEELPISVLLT